MNPPAQNSTEHILNSLNNDCIQSIFDRIENIRDYLSAAETCIRFQENAKNAFRLNYKKVNIIRLYKNGSIGEVQRFLNIFGHLIMDIHFAASQQLIDQTSANEIHNMIADYCGKTLTKYSIASNNLLLNFKTRSALQALKELEVYNINIYNFEYHLQISRLIVDGPDTNFFDWLIQPFPLLETAAFIALHKMQPNQAIDFLKSNPQLRCLDIRHGTQLTPLIFENIGTFTPNLEKLFYFLHVDCSSDFNDYLVNISNLRKLKCLVILPRNDVPIDRLVDALIEKNVPIEKFGIFEKYHLVHELNLPQLKLLKELCLSEISDKTLVKFVKKIPTLEIMMAISSPNITVKGIKRALEFGKQLSVLFVEMENILIDLDDYNSILKLIRGRVKVKIYIKNGSTNIPRDLLEINRKWLKVHVTSEIYRYTNIIEQHWC